MHLQQMSTGAPHPQARNPRISILETFEIESRPALMLEIVGDVLALFLTWHGLRAPRDTLYIMDWKAGVVTMVCMFVRSSGFTLPCDPASEDLIANIPVIDRPGLRNREAIPRLSSYLRTSLPCPVKSPSLSSSANSLPPGTCLQHQTKTPLDLRSPAPYSSPTRQRTYGSRTSRAGASQIHIRPARMRGHGRWHSHRTRRRQ
jgi:hypothetical protein